MRVGAASALRLVVEHPGDTWVERELASSGILYKAEATGDYTYRGTDPAAYDDVFDQESGDTDDLGPLVDFLEFVNDSNDADFVSGLPGRLDVEAFATYLALEDLMENYDAIGRWRTLEEGLPVDASGGLPDGAGGWTQEVFADGWLSGNTATGRPVDVLELEDGSLLVSDDAADMIYRISYTKP